MKTSTLIFIYDYWKSNVNIDLWKRVSIKKGFVIRIKARIKQYWVTEIIKFLTSIWRAFFSIGFNLHSSSDSCISFSSREISHVDECVVECGHKMNNSEVVFFLSSSCLWGTEIICLLFLYFNFFLGWLLNKNYM